MFIYSTTYFKKYTNCPSSATVKSILFGFQPFSFMRCGQLYTVPVLHIFAVVLVYIIVFTSIFTFISFNSLYESSVNWYELVI